MVSLGVMVMALAIAFGLLSISFVPFTFIFYPFMGLVYSLYLWKWKAVLVHALILLLVGVFPGIFWIWVGGLFLLGLVWFANFILELVGLWA